MHAFFKCTYTHTDTNTQTHTHILTRRKEVIESGIRDGHDHVRNRLSHKIRHSLQLHAVLYAICSACEILVLALVGHKESKRGELVHGLVLAQFLGFGAVERGRFERLE